ncbi:MAG: AraC family transcriptional regulator, partial [Bacteroidota bacterium]
VADQIGLTENSFCRFFKKMTGKSFIQFVNEFRINKAAESIHLESKGVGEIMYESGFNDPSFFNRQFRKYRGVSPLSYMKAHRNNHLTNQN